MSRLRIIYISILVLMIALTIVGCGSRSSIEFIPEGGDYSPSEVEAAARAVDITSLENVTYSEISDTRQAHLTDLRGHGSEASLVADALTRDFPVDTAAVPLLVEAMEIDGRQLWMIVEAWAEDGGTLVHRRLWLLDRSTFELVDSMSFR